MRRLAMAMTIIGRRFGHGFSTQKKSSPVMIFASEVPVVAGLNKYRDIEDVFYTVWNRTDPEQVDRLVDELAIESAEEKLKRLVVESGAKDITENALETSAKVDSTEDINRITKTLKSEISGLENVEEEKKEELIKHFQSEIQKGYGSRMEPTAVKHYEEKEKVRVTNSNALFFKKSVGTVNGRDVLVGGRIDGEVGKRVVEVKNRMRRFMDPLPAYDVAQLQTYLHLLDSPEGELVEHLRRSGSKETKSTVIARDEEMWKERILPSLMSFANGLTLFMANPEKQRRFLQSEDGEIKRDIVRCLRSQKVSEAK